MLRLLLGDARAPLIWVGSQLLAKLVLDVVANECACSVGVLGVSGLGMESHFVNKLYS